MGVLNKKNYKFLFIIIFSMVFGLISELSVFVFDTGIRRKLALMMAIDNGGVVAQQSVIDSFSFLRFFTIAVFAFIILFVFIKWRSSKNIRKLTGYELGFLIAVFCFYLLWAVLKKYNYAPDEQMRHDVTLFLFENNRLPKYDELLSHWGFSYAHLPAMLCNQLGYLMMKLAAIFTTNARVLLLAARMVSVLSCTGAVYFVIKLTKLIFKTPARWMVIVVFAFMPQFAFISSYVNNDSLALLGVSIIAYSWALGMYDDWNIKNCLLLSVGLAICATSYYNSYAWILFSVVFFVLSYLYKHKKDYKGLFKYVGIVAGITFLLAGYCFIRHLILYQDLLGFKTTHYYGELYAIPELLPENRLSIAEQGYGLGYMLFDMKWISTTIKSFIGVFGYMQYFCSDKTYKLIIAFFAFAIVGCFVYAISVIKNKKRPDALKTLFYVCVAVCAVVTVCLSVYNSYNTDFQPQGRYCYPAFLTLVLFLGVGYKGILSVFKNEKHKYALVSMFCTAFIATSLYVFNSVYLPS